MKKFALTVALVTPIFFTSCMRCLHPIYTQNDLVFEEAMLGKWRGEGDSAAPIWQFSKQPDGKSYLLVHTDSKGNKAEFDARLARIQGKLFLDIHPRRESDEKTRNDFHDYLQVPAHTFFLVETMSPVLRMRAIDLAWLGKYLNENPNAIAHERNDGLLFVTASTKKLQEFAVKHLDTKDAYTKPLSLKRMKSAE